jgi:hypothetical protein
VNSGTAVYATTSGTATFANAAEQTLYLVRNNTGTTILKGTLLAASGAEPSGRIDVEPFVVTGLQDSELRVMGVATANISNGVNGTVMSFGTLVGVDTRGNVPSALAVGDETWAEGDILFAHPTVAGKLTKVRPQHDLDVAFITVRNATAGQIAIRIVPGNFHLEWLHDVSITSPTNNQVLTYDSASSLWVNANNPADGVTSITATAPLTGGTITSTGSIGIDQTALSITRSQVSDFTSGTVTSASTAQQSGTAVYATNAGTAVFATTSGTATFATNSGTAVFATNASTAVSVSGSAITQSQVVNLVSDLANTAKLNTANTFTVGGHVINNSGTAIVPLQINGVSGQSGDLVQVRDNSGNNNLSVSATYGLVGRNAGTLAFALSSASGIGAFYSQAAGNVPLLARAASGQTANLQEWQTNAGGTALSVNSAGLLTGTRAFAVNQTNSGEAMFVLRGAASQTGDTLAVRDSSANTIAGFSATGRLYAGVSGSGQTYLGGLTLGSGSVASQLGVIAGAATTVGAVIRGAASQTANLQEWQNSAGTVLARVSSAGLFKSGDNIVSNALVGATGSSDVTNTTSVVRIQANSTLGGGWFQANALNAQTGNVASGIGQVYFRTGTNSGTLKLVVRAGSGAEQTILDNIPQ